MEIYGALLLFAFTASITPGPNNIMMLASGVNYGIKKSLPHFFGIAIGFPSMVMLIGLGFNFIFQQYPFLHIHLKAQIFYRRYCLLQSLSSLWRFLV